MQCLRGAGCSINDLTDRDLDRQVERTRYRPLAAGVLDTRQAVAFIGVQLAFGSLVWLQLNTYSKLLALSSLALVVAYPRMKRITSWVRSARSLSALVLVEFFLHCRTCVLQAESAAPHVVRVKLTARPCARAATSGPGPHNKLGRAARLGSGARLS